MICVYPADCTDFSTNGNGIPGSAVGGGDTFDEANAETKHMIIARLVERIEINHDYEVEIKFRISVEQYVLE